MLQGDFLELYRLAVEGGHLELPPPAGYATAIRREVAVVEQQGENLRAWWSSYLRGHVPSLTLPADRPRPSVPDNWGSWVSLGLGGERGVHLHRWCREHGVSSFAAVLACYASTLARYAAVDDVLIGVPVSDRGRGADRRVVGMFVHTVPVRIRGFAAPASQVIDSAQRSLAMVMDHQAYPVEALGAELGDPPQAGSHPLFAATATHQPYQRIPTEPGRQVGTIRFDLSLRLDEDGQRLSGALGGRSQLFDVTTV